MPVFSFASTCHSKSCINGVCKESNECNSVLTNKSGGDITPAGKTLNEEKASDLPLASSSSTNDPIAELLAWIQSILDSIFK